MGQSNADYSGQISQALKQANLPKSNLSQEYSGLLGGAAPNIMSALMNIQGLGNSILRPGAGQTTGGGHGFGPSGTMGGGGGTMGGGGYGFGSGETMMGGGTPFVGGTNGHISTMGNGSQPSQPAPFNPQGFTVGQGTDQNWFNTSGVYDLNNAFNKSLGRNLSQQDINYLQTQLPNGIGGSGWDNIDKLVSDPGYQNNLNTYQNSLGSMGSMGNDGMGANFNMRPPGPGEGGFNYPIDGSGTPGGGGDIYVDGNGNPTGRTADPTGTINDMGPLQQQFFNQGGGFGIGSAQNGIDIGGLMQANPNLQPGSNLLNPDGGANDVLSRLMNMGGPGMNSNNPLAAMMNDPRFTQQFSQMGGLGINGLDQSTDSLLNKAVGSQLGGFTPATADLSKVPNSTQLQPGMDSGFSAIQNILNQQLNKNIADTRERAINTGTANSTGESYDEATLKAQALPQLASALSNLQQTAVGNQLNQAGLMQSGLLQNAGMQNQYGLQGRGQTNDLLSTLLGTSVNSQGQQLQNYFNTIGANQGQNSQLTNLGNLTNQFNTGLNQQGAQNFFNTAGMQSGAAQNLLNSNLGYGSAQNQYNSGLNNILAQLSTSNAQQGNAYNLGVGGMNQQANMQQMQNQMNMLQMLFGGGLGLAGAGIPGGSANVNVGGNAGAGSFGNTLSGIGSIIAALGGL